MSSMYLPSAFILLTIGLVSVTSITEACHTCCESTPKLNWKQCAWNYGKGNPTDNGSIHSCAFYKKATNTHLRVVYQGAIAMVGSGKCSRWYFTFNGNECSGPVPIDGRYYTEGIAINSYRAVTIEGLCSGIKAGIVNVEFKVGACPSIPLGDAHTNLRSHSRVIIEEVNEPQP